MIGQICSVDLLFDAWLSDPEHGAARMTLVRAAKHGDREAFESIRDGFKAWKSQGIDRLLAG